MVLDNVQFYAPPNDDFRPPRVVRRLLGPIEAKLQVCLLELYTCKYIDGYGILCSMLKIVFLSFSFSFFFLSSISSISCISILRLSLSFFVCRKKNGTSNSLIYRGTGLTMKNKPN